MILGNIHPKSVSAKRIPVYRLTVDYKKTDNMVCQFKRGHLTPARFAKKVDFIFN